MWLWALLPVTTAVFGIIGLWTVFGIAVSNQTVNLTVKFPYISKCGSYNPQSCLFSQICNICSVLALWIVFIRFQQVRDLGCSSRKNTASLVIGFISSIGISILGNFQLFVLKKVHLVGAMLMFFGGLAYFWLQVWLTYYAEPSQDRKRVGPARIVLCSVCTCLILAMFVLHNTGYRSEAAKCEWAAVMCFLVLFAVFAAEFRHIDFFKVHVQNDGFTKEEVTRQANQTECISMIQTT